MLRMSSLQVGCQPEACEHKRHGFTERTSVFCEKLPELLEDRKCFPIK